jgi:hypothetical protein
VTPEERATKLEYEIEFCAWDREIVRHNIAAAIREAEDAARAAERERCAVMLDVKAYNEEKIGDLVDAIVFRDIARRIREGEK